MICGMGGFTESRHNNIKDCPANKTRELEGATVMVEKEGDVPFAKQTARMDLIFNDARRREFALIDVVIPTGWSPNDGEADRQLNDTPRTLKQQNRERKGNNIRKCDALCNKRYLNSRTGGEDFVIPHSGSRPG